MNLVCKKYIDLLHFLGIKVLFIKQCPLNFMFANAL